MNPSSADYAATRLTYHSAADFNETRARLDELVPLLEPGVTVELVLSGAWTDVEAAVDRTAGPTGLVALARLDTGALQPERAGTRRDPLPRRQPRRGPQGHRDRPAAALYAPFRVAIYQDASGVHLAYDQPSSLFKSLGSPAVDRIAVELDEKIRIAVENACQ